MAEPSAERPTRQTPRPRLLLGLALCVVATAYSNSLEGPFLWDDKGLIEHERSIQSTEGWRRFFARPFMSDPLGDWYAQVDFYRPLTAISYALDYRLWRGHPLGFHLTNLIAHLACCALVFAWARRCAASAVAATLAAAGFGVLPRLTESVSWISGRTDVLATACALSSVLLARSESSRWFRLVASAALLLAGLLFKEVAVAVVPSLILCVSSTPSKDRQGPMALVRFAPYAAALTVYAMLRVVVADLPALQSSSNPARLTSWERIALPFEALGTYVTMLADPLRPRIAIGTVGLLSPALTALGACSALALAVGGWHVARSRRPMMQKAAGAAAVLGLLPVILLAERLPTVAADRFLYLPAASLAVFLGAEITRVQVPGWARRAATGAVGIVILGFDATTYLRNRDWSDELRLWNTAVDGAPEGNSSARMARGQWSMEHGRPQDALEDFARALEIARSLDQRRGLRPWHPAIRLNSAVCHLRLGNVERAIELLEPDVDARPVAKRSRLVLALAKASRTEFEAAEDLLRGGGHLANGDQAFAAALLKVRKARAILEPLPPEAEGEAAAVSAARARAYAELGADALAATRWRRAAEAPDATVETVARAAAYLSEKGTPTDASRALERLRTFAGTERTCELVDEAISMRREDLSVARFPR